MRGRPVSGVGEVSDPAMHPFWPFHPLSLSIAKGARVRRGQKDVQWRTTDFAYPTDRRAGREAYSLNGRVGDPMGKRSNFERRERDFYPTPRKAVLPLVPYLRRDRIRTFAEPCVGDGDLARALESHGFVCRYAGDIATGQDALASDGYGEIDAIITNPPFSLLVPMIQHFQEIAPTWLFGDLDWTANKYFAEFLRSTCSDIVPIGRLQLIPNSKCKSGK